MKKLGWLIGIALIVLSSVALLAQHQKSAPGTLTEVSVERTACYGTCPVYKVILRSDGTATFIGRRYTDHVGTYKAAIGPLDRLSQAVQGHGFFGLADRYTAAVTDQPHVITTVLQGGRRKTVDNYADAGPQRLWEIQTLVDAMGPQAKWVKVNAPAHPKAP